MTKKLRYQVRGRDGKVLTTYQLQLVLPKFTGAELVNIGDKLLSRRRPWLGTITCLHRHKNVPASNLHFSVTTSLYP